MHPVSTNMNPSTRLAEMLRGCSSGWIEAVDTAIVRGTSAPVLLEATQCWRTGAYEHADLLVAMGETVDYTVVTDQETLTSALMPLADAGVVAVDTETYAPAEVRTRAECAEIEYSHVRSMLALARESVRLATTQAQKRAARAVCDATKDQLKTAKARLKNAKTSLKEAGLNPHQARIRLMQLAVKNHPVIVVDLDAFDSVNELEPLKWLLMSDSVKVFHNANFDIKMLWSSGFNVNGQIFDTMLAARLLSPSGRVTLAEIARTYLDISLPKGEQTSDWSRDLTDSQLLYAVHDVRILLRLRERLKSRLADEALTEVAKIEFDCVRATAEMEYSGMKLDTDQINRYRRRVEARQRELQTILYGYLGELNLASPTQLKTALTNIGVEVESTSRRALHFLVDSHPCISTLLAYKKLSTLITSFFNPVPRATSAHTGRVHANYWQLGAATGRFSCSGPNFQQVPRDMEVRRCFTAETGRKLIIADYSQIELRVAAAISADAKMIEAYRNGEDLHRLTASLVQNISPAHVTQEQRNAAKAINFGLIYGMGPKGLMYSAKANYGVEMSLAEAEKFKRRYFEAYSGIRDWHRKSSCELRYAHKQRTLCGRRFVWREPPSFTVYVNRQVQGTAADIAKIALGRLPFSLKGTQAKIIAMIHDEIIIEVPEAGAHDAAAILQRTMETAGNEVLKTVPVVAEARIADNWAQK